MRRMLTGAWTDAVLCAILLAGTGWSASILTGGFEHWTFEAQRRAEARGGLLHASALTLLTAQGGTSSPWQPDSLDQTVYVLDFFYTRCPSVCRALGSEYAQMQAALAGAETPVRLLSVSFDLEHDDGDALRTYAKRIGARAPLWEVARPADAPALQRLLRELGVVMVPDGTGGYVHNAALHLVDARGELRAIVDVGDWPRALEQARVLASLSRPEPP